MDIHQSRHDLRGNFLNDRLLATASCTEDSILGVVLSGFADMG